MNFLPFLSLGGAVYFPSAELGFFVCLFVFEREREGGREKEKVSNMDVREKH